VWTIRIANRGAGAARDVRLDGFVLTPAEGRDRDARSARSPRITSRDPNRFPVPVAGTLPPGAAATADVTVDVPSDARFEVTIPFSANGGRTRGVIRSRE